jgi:hypothetical protein
MKAHLTVVYTDTILMEYVRMPIQDLSHQFLYRFIEPVKTCWLNGAVSLFDVTKTPAEIITDGPTNKQLEDFAIKDWSKDVKEEDIAHLRPEDKEIFQLKKARVFECEIVRKV